MGADPQSVDCPTGRIISIHGPRVGADRFFLDKSTGSVISIHGPRVGADGIDPFDYFNLGPFQSTVPVWGPTPAVPVLACKAVISIHGPRVGADYSLIINNFFRDISIHGPRVGPTIAS